MRKLRELRKAKGLKQSEFAKRFCVGQTCVARWEKDDIFPPAEQLPAIADFFGCSIDELFGREKGGRG